ncbi:SSU ribosomal protein S19E [Ignisphaera aggregans DSM 17230]|uniref:Small ribosomal subunit protein eS19 n=1 Tax=Ignisphaera aggregans (strain DSM 17230 / JCM 13409 / AQ1.S1) TaxID=583356 RepID=E0SQF5_IGNAA|nr:SSU ribosomal protein S19E [Ignisphaera aggregans DSM 17230]
MVTVRDVPADMLIDRLAKYLKENISVIRPPHWALFSKTGSHRERVPDNPDWWYYRAAAILRKLYLAEEPIGIETFRTIFGGLKRRGSAPPHFRKCGGSNIRKILQQLEAAHLVMKTPKGRVISGEGRRLLDRIANEIFNELIKTRPELAKYGSLASKQVQS